MYARVLASTVGIMRMKMQSQSEEASQRYVKHHMISLHSFPLTLSACCLILLAVNSREGLIIGLLK